MRQRLRTRLRPKPALAVWDALVGQLAAGYELRITSRTWLTARARATFGRVQLLGVSLGISRVLAGY